MTEARLVYFISDRTGITAEALGKSLLTQFDHIQFEHRTLAYVDSPQRALAALDQINRSTQATGRRPIVFSTLMKPELRQLFTDANAVWICVRSRAQATSAAHGQRCHARRSDGSRDRCVGR